MKLGKKNDNGRLGVGGKRVGRGEWGSERQRGKKPRAVFK